MQKKRMRRLAILFSLSVLLQSTTALSLESKELLKQLVETSSGTSDVKGVNDVQRLFGNELKKLGFNVEYKPYPGGKLGDLLIATFGDASLPSVTFLVHADTVFEKSSGFTGYRLNEDGQKAFGPGVIDAKGGMIVLLKAIEKFLVGDPKPKFSLRVVSSPAEETGAPEFLALYQKIALDSHLVLGFEPALDDGSIIESRRGNRWYEISVVGREAHAGRAHREGVNACVDLSSKLTKLSRLTNYSKDLTVAIGHMEGGQDKFNIICGSASAKVDVRFSDYKLGLKVDKTIRTIAAEKLVKAPSDGVQTETSIRVADETNPFPTDQSSKKYIQKILKAIQGVEGGSVKSKASGGSADTNLFARPGLAIVDGLGPVGGKMHTKDEFIFLSSIESRSSAIAEFLKELRL